MSVRSRLTTLTAIVGASIAWQGRLHEGGWSDLRWPPECGGAARRRSTSSSSPRSTRASGFGAGDGELISPGR